MIKFLLSVMAIATSVPANARITEVPEHQMVYSASSCPELTKQWFRTQNLLLNPVLRLVDIKDVYVANGDNIITVNDQKWNLSLLFRTEHLGNVDTFDFLVDAQTNVTLTKKIDNDQKIKCNYVFSNPKWSQGRGTGVTIVLTVPTLTAADVPAIVEPVIVASPTTCPELTSRWINANSRFLIPMLIAMDKGGTYTSSKGHNLKIDNKSWDLTSLSRTEQLGSIGSMDFLTHAQTSINLTKKFDSNQKIQCIYVFSNPQWSTGRGSGITLILRAH